jgi:hypothetical protein
LFLSVIHASSLKGEILDPWHTYLVRACLCFLAVTNSIPMEITLNMYFPFLYSQPYSKDDIFYGSRKRH